MAIARKMVIMDATDCWVSLTHSTYGPDFHSDHHSLYKNPRHPAIDSSTASHAQTQNLCLPYPIYTLAPFLHSPK